MNTLNIQMLITLFRCRNNRIKCYHDWHNPSRDWELACSRFTTIYWHFEAPQQFISDMRNVTNIPTHPISNLTVDAIYTRSLLTIGAIYQIRTASNRSCRLFFLFSFSWHFVNFPPVDDFCNESVAVSRTKRISIIYRDSRRLSNLIERIIFIFISNTEKRFEMML